MWNIPGPGIKLVFPVLAARFLDHQRSPPVCVFKGVFMLDNPQGWLRYIVATSEQSNISFTKALNYKIIHSLVYLPAILLSPATSG